MTALLLKLFASKGEDTSSPEVRHAYGALSGGVGILCNLLLFASKIAAGILTASVSVVADAFNNLSDAASSIITIIGFKLANKPADSEHPYGHGRYEYISGFIISLLIMLMALELFKSSAVKIIHPEAPEFSAVSVCILVVSIAVKFWLAKFNKRLGNKINSSALLATSADSRNDCIVTLAVLISILMGSLYNINIDGFAGLVVAVFVFKAGIDAASDTLRPLLGQAPDPEFVKAIEEEVLKEKRIRGIHDMHIHDYGPGRLLVSLHAEIPADMNIMEAHDAIDGAEERIKRKYNCEISIHMDPIETDNKNINRIRKQVGDALYSISPELGFHDFRMTDGPDRTNIIFDLEIPFGFEGDDGDIKARAEQAVRALNDKYYPVIEVDKVIK